MLGEPAVVDTPNGPVSGLIDQAAEARAAMVLAHGAGAGMRHPFMADVAAALADRGVSVLRYQFPYLEAGRNRPDSPAVATATVRAALDTARSRWPDLPLFAGGKSFGGRMSSTAAAEGLLDAVRGLVFFGFPLHPPKRPATARGDHLDRVAVPMLFLQGTRDDLAEIGLIREVTGRLGSRATLHEIPEATHAFGVPKRTGRTGGDIIIEMATIAAEWIGGVTGAG
jgi:predicted alpha/beta-hydrolase family hydrolase